MTSHSSSEDEAQIKQQAANMLMEAVKTFVRVPTAATSTGSSSTGRGRRRRRKRLRSDAENQWKLDSERDDDDDDEPRTSAEGPSRQVQSQSSHGVSAAQSDHSMGHPHKSNRQPFETHKHPSGSRHSSRFITPRHSGLALSSGSAATRPRRDHAEPLPWKPNAIQSRRQSGQDLSVYAQSRSPL